MLEIPPLLSGARHFFFLNSGSIPAQGTTQFVWYRVLLGYPVKPGPRSSQFLALSDRNGRNMIFHRSYRLLPGNYSPPVSIIE